MNNLTSMLFYKISFLHFYTRGIKKLSILLSSAILFTLLTTGCRLANPDMGSANDTLIGVYVTTEYIDTLDWDNISINSSGSVDVKSKNDGRIYGTLNTEEETVSFPDIEGSALLSLSVEENDENYHNTTITGHFSDTHTSITDIGCEISGTLYYDISKVSTHHLTASPEDAEDYENTNTMHMSTETQEDGTILYDHYTEGEALIMYVYPIFKTAGGEIYLIAQPGISSYSGGEISTSFSSSESTTANGKTSSYTTKFTVTLKAEAPSDTITFTQIGKNRNTLQEDTYSAEKIPETYIRNKESSYILVTSLDSDGNTTYDTINTEDEFFSLYLPTKSIFCDKVLIEVKDQ